MPKEQKTPTSVEVEKEVRLIIGKYGTSFKGDPAIMHQELDKLMERTLIALGYEKAVKMIRAQTRWYE